MNTRLGRLPSDSVNFACYVFASIISGASCAVFAVSLVHVIAHAAPVPVVCIFAVATLIALLGMIFGAQAASEYR